MSALNDPEKNPSDPVSGKNPALASTFEMLKKKRVTIPLAGLILLGIIGMYILGKDPARLPYASEEADPMASEREQSAAVPLLSVDGKTSQLSDHLGNVVLVTFWGTECPACVIEFAAFNELQKRYRGEGFQVLAINIDPKEVGHQAATDLWSTGKFEFGSYLDPDRKAADAMNAGALPSSFVIDRKGRLAFTSYGANSWLAPETARMIEDLLMESK